MARTESQVQAALQAVETEAASQAEKIEMLVEIAMGLQTRPRHSSDLEAAVRLYDAALQIADPGKV